MVGYQHGRDGNVQTLREMAQFVRRDATRDVGLHDFALSILNAAGVRGHHAEQEIEAFFLYARDRIDWVADSAGLGQSLADARTVIELARGNCVWKSVLLASLLACTGHLPRFVVIRLPDSEHDDPTSFDHVYVEVQRPDGDGWLALDPTNEKRPVGWEARYEQRMVFTIYGSLGTNDLAGLKSVFKKIGKGVVKVGKVAAPIAAGFIPGVGAFASAGVSAGIDAASNKAAQKKAAQQEAAQQQEQQSYAAQGEPPRNAGASQGGSARSGFEVSPGMLAIGGVVAVLFALKG